MQAIRLQKAWYKYVPWVALLSLIIMTVGMILWAVGSNRALDGTNELLQILAIDVSSMLTTVRQVAIGAVVACMLMAVVMVLMAVGRTSLEKKIDEQGRAVCGTWLWLAIQAILAALWWFLLFWMVWVIFGSCVWYVAFYAVEGALSYTQKLQHRAIDKLNGVFAGNGTGVQTNTTTACPSNCFNLAYFSYYTSVDDRCVCESTKIDAAWAAADTAAQNLHLTVAGAFIMWVGCSFLLLESVSNFATTKRERELLLRAQRNAAQQASTSLMVQPGMMQGDPYKDTLPLLGGGQHSVIQMQPPQGQLPMQVPPGMQMRPQGLRPA